MSDLAAAVAAERTGRSEILNAKAKLLAAEAAVDQAKADAAEARANVGVAEARLDRAKVNLDYAKIVAPFDGVVTHRSFHVGALIHSAAEGEQPPLLTVKRTDKMRVVVLVPDGDVVLTKLGDAAVVSVDALGGRSFTGTLARIARAEDAERMMRVEIDLMNPDDVLCDGMYGKAIDHPGARRQEPGGAGGRASSSTAAGPAGLSSSSATGSPGAPRSSWAATTAPMPRSAPGSGRTTSSCFPPERRSKTACASTVAERTRPLDPRAGGFRMIPHRSVSTPVLREEQLDRWTA